MINIEEKGIYDRYMNRNILNSEYQFSTLFAWSESFAFSIKIIDDTMLILGKQHNGDIQCYYPLGQNPIDKRMETVKKFFRDNHLPINIRPLSKSMLDEIMPYLDFPFESGTKPSYSDYVCNCAAIRTYEGPHYRKKRKDTSRFHRSYDNKIEYVSITPENAQEALHGIKGILQLGPYDEDEMAAYSKFFNNFRELGLRGGMLMDNNVIIGVTTGESYTCNGQKSIMLNMRRCNKNYTGIYPAILQLMINNEFSDDDYRYVNMQDDMNLENLRKTKLSYKPEMLLEKYYIREKDD